ncbi:hypothetical protein BLX24_26615 [Arsenicibacter rosenii]|uniref:Uncharacterized protein n=2 Tax=Arsenicibacter rosenii TaxID=1750698 RepID=A0A1S2VBF4_9BACT|nr:hypothetical protein BLX24_26615 [Arsenicibacter rosenii]
MLVVSGLLLLTCQPDRQTPKHLSPAFYFWQTTFRLSPTEQQALKSHHVSTVYVRFFDVDLDAQRQQPVPKAPIRFTGKLPAGLRIVPVVFITNQTLRQIRPAAIRQLAEHLLTRIKAIAQEQGIQPAEIQLDCDWTQSTRDRYFALIQLVRKQSRVPVSATIRLHQVKYMAQTGVPPADRGMLMVYNMSDWKRPDTRNSIYDVDVAERYTSVLDQYPLPLDVVFPLFRWTVVYRNARFLVLLNNLEQATLRKQPFLAMQTDTNRFVARRDTVALGLSIRKGDLFRAEACSVEELARGKAAILKKIQTEKITFALYHLDSTVLTRYPHAFIKSLFRSVP